MNNKHIQQHSTEHYTQINNYKHSSFWKFEATSVEFYVDELYTSLLKGKLRPYDNHDGENDKPLHTVLVLPAISITLKMETQSVPETLENFHTLTRMSAREDFI
jgi:hypothetical protein